MSIGDKTGVGRGLADANKNDRALLVLHFDNAVVLLLADDAESLVSFFVVAQFRGDMARIVSRMAGKLAASVSVWKRGSRYENVGKYSLSKMLQENRIVLLMYGIGN